MATKVERELGELRPSTVSDLARHVEEEIPFLRRIVRRWHLQGADAEDLVQDTLVRALSGAHLFEPGTNLRAWLVVIMRNQCLSRLARSKRADAANSAYAEAADGVAPHRSDARLILRDVEHALRHLTQQQRAALLMISVDGRSYRDVAQATGRSIAAIRCDLARARQCLRQAVTGEELRLPWARAAHAATTAPAAFAQPLQPLPSRKATATLAAVGWSAGVSP